MTNKDLTLFPAEYNLTGLNQFFAYGVNGALAVAKAVEWAMLPENEGKSIKFATIQHPSSGEEVYRIFEYAFFRDLPKNQHPGFYDMAGESRNYLASGVASEDNESAACHTAQLVNTIYRLTRQENFTLVRLQA